MQTVTRRIYDVDEDGRRYLRYRPGDRITDQEAERVAYLVNPEPEKPGWMFLLERRPDGSLEPPAPTTTALGRMKLQELKDVCEAEGIDPGGANLRSEYIAAIKAGRAAAGSND